MLKNIIYGLPLTLLSTVATAENSFFTLPTLSECGKSEDVVGAYLQNFNETPYFNGIGYVFLDQETTRSGFLVVAANLDTGTFSVVMNFTDGTSCVVVSGTQFKPFDLSAN